MRSDTPSEGSESAGDEVVKKSGNEVKRVRSLRNLRRKKIVGDGAAGDEETSFLERFKNTVTTSDPEKQRKKSIRRKQKEEVSSDFILYPLLKSVSFQGFCSITIFSPNLLRLCLFFNETMIVAAPFMERSFQICQFLPNGKKTEQQFNSAYRHRLWIYFVTVCCIC